MEVAVPVIILALMIVLGLIFYEHSRRTDAARQETLYRRIGGDYKPAKAETQPASQPKPSRWALPYVNELLRPLERWLAQCGLGIPAHQYILLTVLTGVAGLLVTVLWMNAGVA
ncbi:MAG: hypothetical protein JO071_07005, partial [Deltaproteobacteria bacterium]|nr:hypothetical protein [Deltaproteobacteria bacterium]